MNGNKINGILWLLLAGFLVLILVRGLSGKKLHNFKVITFHTGNSNNWEVEDIENLESDSDSENGYVTWTFNADQVRNIDLNVVSSSIKFFPSNSENEIKVMISDNVDVRNLFEVGLKNSNLVIRRKSKVNIGIITDAREVIVTVPETVFETISLKAVSGSALVKNVSARKINVECVSGSINAENLQGRLRLDSVSGSIRYETDKLKNNLEAESVSGSIKVILPKKSDFSADFETVSGSVSSDFNKTGRKEGTIKNGDRTYDLRFETVSGSISVSSH